MTRRAALVLIPLAALAGCKTSSTSNGSEVSFKPVEPATKAQQAALLDRMKTLSGTWSTQPHEGAPAGTIVFATTSNGSAVREVMLPGTPQEMINVYTMDGPTMVMTHYCAMGNQPHLRASAPTGPHDPIVLKCDGVGNLASADQMFMGQLMITFVDDNHIRETWTSFQSGKPAGEHASFELTRSH